VVSQSLMVNRSLGWIYYLTGRSARAIEHPEKTLELDPDLGGCIRYARTIDLLSDSVTEVLAPPVVCGGVHSRRSVANAWPLQHIGFCRFARRAC
jgi:hypothetical protein